MQVACPHGTAEAGPGKPSAASSAAGGSLSDGLAPTTQADGVEGEEDKVRVQPWCAQLLHRARLAPMVRTQVLHRGLPGHCTLCTQFAAHCKHM